MRLRYAALSDVGRVRKDNQDSGYARPHLLVVADGVGGAARGDIASAVDRRGPAPARRGPPERTTTCSSALAGAIHRSHDRLAELVDGRPRARGHQHHRHRGHLRRHRASASATSVTAAATCCATARSSQLTKDHTFVQSLIDEGRITEDEARVHPHRNLILRAVDGVHDPEPDLFTLDAGARRPDPALLRRLLRGARPTRSSPTSSATGTLDHAAVALVSASLDAGSTDNVTVVVADVVGTTRRRRRDERAAVTGPMVVGAAAEPPPARRPAPARRATAPTPASSSPCRRTPRTLDPEELRYAPAPRAASRWARRLAVARLVLLALALIVAVAGYKLDARASTTSPTTARTSPSTEASRPTSRASARTSVEEASDADVWPTCPTINAAPGRATASPPTASSDARRRHQAAGSERDLPSRRRRPPPPSPAPAAAPARGQAAPAQPKRTAEPSRPARARRPDTPAVGLDHEHRATP